MTLTAITDEVQQKKKKRKKKKKSHPDEKTEGVLCDKHTLHYTHTFSLLEDFHPHMDLT